MTTPSIRRLRILDSHTGGEPTRVVLDGMPDLGPGSVADQLARFRNQYDTYRSAIVNEPRGSDVLVGALLVPPSDPTCVCGVIFFNNVGYLGMCGHGTIGLMVTLFHLGRIQPGTHRIETSVGIITATLNPDGSVSVANVPSYRKQKAVPIQVPEIGTVHGDLVWGGNWFFLVDSDRWELDLKQIDTLTEVTWRIRKAVNAQGYPEVDHIELFGPPQNPKAHSRNFVLCPGKAYDRSPCGTGTSAKLACLAADRKLEENAEWIQESILGSQFRGSFQWLDRTARTISPRVTGTAFVTGEATLLLNAEDPFCWGIRT